VGNNDNMLSVDTILRQPSRVVLMESLWLAAAMRVGVIRDHSDTLGHSGLEHINVNTICLYHMYASSLSVPLTSSAEQMSSKVDSPAGIETGAGELYRGSALAMGPAASTTNYIRVEGIALENSEHYGKRAGFRSAMIVL